MKYRLAEIAQRLGLELIGDPSVLIEGIASLASAQPNQISFLTHSKNIKNLSAIKAAAVIVRPEFRSYFKCSVLLSDNPYLSFAELTSLFDNAPVQKIGIHPSANIHSSVLLPESVSVGPNVVIESGVVIGARSVIKANSVIGENAIIGEDCFLHANVTLYHHVVLGNNVTIHSSSVIGADGFGFANTGLGIKGTGTTWKKIHQLGGVRIGNNVDIGANTCIDRGALENTVIHDGVIIDNQVQIAHNCIIGENTAIAGCVGIAGSTIIGKNCTLAGGVGVAGHLEITDNVHVTSMALVTGSITQSGSYSSGTAMMPTKAWRKSAVRFTQLENLQSRVKQLEQEITELSKK